MLLLWLLLFVAGRLWLAKRARKLQAQRRPFDSSFALWLKCIWGWTWRSILWFLIPGGIFFIFATNGNYSRAGYSIGMWIGAFITAMVLCLDAPCWYLRKAATAKQRGVPHDNTIYDEIAEEFRLGTYNQGLWLKSVAGAEGDPNKATALYTSERAVKLAAERARIEQKPTSTSALSRTDLGFIIIGCTVVFWVWAFATHCGKIPLSDLAQEFLNLPATSSGQALTSTIISTENTPDSTASQLPTSPHTPSAATQPNPFAGIATPVPPPPPGVTFIDQSTATASAESLPPPPVQASTNTQGTDTVVPNQIKQPLLFSELPASSQQAVVAAWSKHIPGSSVADAQQAYDSQVRAETGTLKRMATEEDIQNAVRLGIDPTAFIHNGVLDPVTEARALAAAHADIPPSNGE